MKLPYDYLLKPDEKIVFNFYLGRSIVFVYIIGNYQSTSTQLFITFCHTSYKVTSFKHLNDDLQTIKILKITNVTSFL